MWTFGSSAEGEALRRDPPLAELGALEWLLIVVGGGTSTQVQGEI